MKIWQDVQFNKCFNFNHLVPGQDKLRSFNVDHAPTKVTDNPGGQVDLNKESSLLAQVDEQNGQTSISCKGDSSLKDGRTEAVTATINSSNSINTNINSAQTDSQIIKSKWNVSSPSVLIHAINSGSQCLMGHKEVLTASLHTTVAHNQPLLTSDCYSPVTIEMEAPSVSHCSPFLYDSVNATAHQYINYNKHMLEIKQQLAQQSSQQPNGNTDQHCSNGQSGDNNVDNMNNTELLLTDLKVKENYLETEIIPSINYILYMTCPKKNLPLQNITHNSDTVSRRPNRKKMIRPIVLQKIGCTIFNTIWILAMNNRTKKSHF